jgi:lysophospholipase L1-like esterase
MRTRKLIIAATAAALAIVAATVWRPAFGDTTAREQIAAADTWTGTWAASPQGSGTTFNQQTLRQIVHTSIGGTAARVRLSNVFGNQPVTIANVHLAKRTSGSSVDAASDRAVTFGGATTTTIPVGGSVVSDQVAFGVAALADVAVSFYLPQATGNATVHDFGNQTNYVAAGNVAANATLSGAQTRGNYFFLTNLDVQNTAAEGAVATLGASITDGIGSGGDANRRWPNDLAVRLNQAGRTIGVLNQGISGNRLLADGAGQSAANRFERDVLSQPNVKWVIFSDDPINDLGSDKNNPPTGQRLIDAVKPLIDRAHQAGVKFICSTLTPFEGSGGWSAAAETSRGAYNAFVRGPSSGCDGVVDQDNATHDPARPTWFRANLETGDHLHPNEAGLQAIADAVALSLFGTGGTTPPATVVSLRAHANGKLVTAESGGSAPLIANRTAVGPWEQFDRLDLGNGRIALRAHANGRLVTAAGGGSSALIASGTTVGAAETFDLIRNPDGSVALRATVNARYVCAENAGAASLIANRTAIGAWESFDLL